MVSEINLFQIDQNLPDTQLEVVCQYAESGWPVFPCKQDKRPYTAKEAIQPTRQDLAQDEVGNMSQKEKRPTGQWGESGKTFVLVDNPKDSNKEVNNATISR